ncbi:MAG TPA: helix-turn-helix domain-containing protein [Candidatus Competibacteraceae bacterium]|nr:helix-turn-helix domain-containing protein [Candidatus Competibacteraceae bacterium]HQA25871.1 helix-turn-helix domain-containing protein [Candidatus Competibacteraceae bacterium]HQD57061.1 helix-turn-helix domain-containing protein [Candidatus Competibacteraceae bacterium]
MSPKRTIGVLSRESGVNLETIRYYERIGLLPHPLRSTNGYRYYDETMIKRLRFIRRGRELGFSIDEVKTLLQLADNRDQPCREADRLVQAHLVEVEAKIADLMALRDVLTQLTHCQSPTTEHCRLIETLEQRRCCITSD